MGLWDEVGHTYTEPETFVLRNNSFVLQPVNVTKNRINAGDDRMDVFISLGGKPDHKVELDKRKTRKGRRSLFITFLSLGLPASMAIVSPAPRPALASSWANSSSIASILELGRLQFNLFVCTLPVIRRTNSGRLGKSVALSVKSPNSE